MNSRRYIGPIPQVNDGNKRVYNNCTPFSHVRGDPTRSELLVRTASAHLGAALEFSFKQPWIFHPEVHDPVVEGKIDASKGGERDAFSFFLRLHLGFFFPLLYSSVKKDASSPAWERLSSQCQNISCLKLSCRSLEASCRQSNSKLSLEWYLCLIWFSDGRASKCRFFAAMFVATVTILMFFYARLPSFICHWIQPAF